MELERDVLVSPCEEVPVIEGELVTAIRTLAGRGVGKKADRTWRDRPVRVTVFGKVDRATITLCGS
jgi:hypothetical protein